MCLAHFKMLNFFRFFKYGGGGGCKTSRKILSSTSSCKFVYVFGTLRYVNSLTSWCILTVYSNDLKSKLILLNLKHFFQRPHSEVYSLKKCTLSHAYFVFKCLVL